MTSEKRTSITGHVEAGEVSGARLTGVAVGRIGADVSQLRAEVEALHVLLTRTHEDLVARLGGAVQAQALSDRLAALETRVRTLETIVGERGA